MKQDDFFVGVYDPLDVRRNILEGSKEIVKSIKLSDNIQAIREEKQKHYAEMKKIMGELDLLVTKLKERLPQSHLRKSTGSKKAPVHVTNELKKLEKELMEVEEELSKIK